MDAKGRLLRVAIDGRQPGYSEGVGTKNGGLPGSPFP
jgi:hypothetical protein